MSKRSHLKIKFVFTDFDEKLVNIIDPWSCEPHQDKAECSRADKIIRVPQSR